MKRPAQPVPVVLVLTALLSFPALPGQASAAAPSKKKAATKQGATAAFFSARPDAQKFRASAEAELKKLFIVDSRAANYSDISLV